MQADRQRAAKTLSSCFLEQHGGYHHSRFNPLALHGYLLLLYVFSCSEHLTKDNLFGCLMLRHWLAEDYMRWTSDLWRLVKGWSKYVRWCVWTYMQRVCVCVRACVCAQFQVLALTQTSVVFQPALSLLSHYRKTFVTCLFFFHTITFIVCLKINNLWITLFQDLWNRSFLKDSLYALAARRTTDLLCAASRTAAKRYCEPSQTSHWQTLPTHKQVGAQGATEALWIFILWAMETISSLTGLMQTSISLRGSYFTRLQFHPTTWPNNLSQNLVFIVSLESFFFKCYPALGKMNPSVLSSSREQRDHQIHLNCCTKHLAAALHLIRWRPFERCCRTRSWRALPSDDKKVNYWFVYHALKTQSALLNREHIKGGVLLKVF